MDSHSMHYEYRIMTAAQSRNSHCSINCCWIHRPPSNNSSHKMSTFNWKYISKWACTEESHSISKRCFHFFQLILNSLQKIVWQEMLCLCGPAHLMINEHIDLYHKSYHHNACKISEKSSPKVDAGPYVYYSGMDYYSMYTMVAANCRLAITL